MKNKGNTIKFRKPMAPPAKVFKETRRELLEKADKLDQIEIKTQFIHSTNCRRGFNCSVTCA